jgi:hypothetical protein
MKAFKAGVKVKLILFTYLLPAYPLTLFAQGPIKVLLLTDYQDFWHDYRYQSEVFKNLLPCYANLEIKT